MRLLALYLRARHAPAALALAGGLTVVQWSLWSVFSDARDVDVAMVVLTILLLVAGLTSTLGGPDDALDATAGLRWPPRRLTHLAIAFLVVLAVLLPTLITGARFGPVWLVVRDAAGLLGLTALGAAVIGTARAWFVPLGWTVAAVVFPQAGSVVARTLTWQSQPLGSTTATVTAGVLALAGLVAYTAVGPAHRPPAEAAHR